MARFESAIHHTLKNEGGYSNHSADRGGKTKYGITEKVARNHGYLADMQDLTEAMAQEIYRVNYWNPLKLDCVNSQEVANELFDTAVNMGVGTAAKFLQQSINLLSSAKLKVDGKIGPKSLSCMGKLNNDKILLKCLNGLQFCKYKRIVFLHPSQKVFFRGWMRRI